MTKRIVVYNSFAPIVKVATRDLKRGDVIFGTGEKVAGFAKNRTGDGRVHVALEKGGYRRIAAWDADALIGAVQKNEMDGVGTAKEIAYGEGWHSKENNNPYDDPIQKKAWEEGREAYKRKAMLNRHSAYQGPMGAGLKRKVGFEAPKSRDFRSERGYVGKLINPQTGGVMARSEPFIRQERASEWIKKQAVEFIRKGKRVKGEVSMEFYDPDKVADAILSDSELINKAKEVANRPGVERHIQKNLLDMARLLGTTTEEKYRRHARFHIETDIQAARYNAHIKQFGTN